MTKPRRDLLVLVPTLNEAPMVERALRAIATALPLADILLIDDDSPDGTGRIAQGLRAELLALDVMVRKGGPKGLGAAIQAGYRYAIERGYAEVCIVDCDLQQDPADVDRLCRADPLADMVVGSRYVETGLFRGGYKTGSKLLSITCNRAINLMFNAPCRDVSTNFCVVRTRVFERVPVASFTCAGFAFFSEVKLRAARAGYRVVEVGVPTYGRAGGQSKRSRRQVVAYGQEILALWAELVLAGPTEEAP